jgi:hypothetical protein
MEGGKEIDLQKIMEEMRVEMSKAVSFYSSASRAKEVLEGYLKTVEAFEKKVKEKHDENKQEVARILIILERVKKILLEAISELDKKIDERVTEMLEFEAHFLLKWLINSLDEIKATQSIQSVKEVLKKVVDELKKIYF